MSANVPTQNPANATPQSTFVVSTVVKVNKQALPVEFGIEGIRVYKAANKIPFALLTLYDGDSAKGTFKISDTNYFTPGNEVEILAGYHLQESTIFKGIIVRHGVKILPGAPAVLEVECKDPVVKLSVDRKNKYYDGLKDSELIEEIAQRYGLAHEVADTGYQHQSIVQYFATDWDFLVMRAETNGMLALPNDGVLKVKRPDFTQTPRLSLKYGLDIFEYEAEMDARDQYPHVQATMWSQADQQPSSVQADETSVGMAGSSSPATANMPNTDLRKALGVQQFQVQHPGHLPSPELQTWAEAQVIKSRLARLRGRVTCQGLAQIAPGDCIRISGVGKRHEGIMYVTGVFQEIVGKKVWSTHLQFGFPSKWFIQEYSDVADAQAAAMIPPVNGLQIGKVTKLAGDPNLEERIQVRLPLIDNQGDGVWVRLAGQDAGNTRGAVWRPEIGDEVVLGFLNDDPRCGIVLGALHSSANPAPIAADDANPRKGWATKNGLKITLDDDQKSTVVETPAGKKITLDDTADLIRIEDQHQNCITMDANGIEISAGQKLMLKAGQNVVVNAGANIENTATATFKADAQAQVEITAMGPAIIKGALVKIN